MNKSVAIIGAGASGLVCGNILSQRGFQVTIYEKELKVGKKILASGNGRCNITNAEISIGNFHGEDPSFVAPLLQEFSTKKCIDLFREFGIEFVQESNKFFPMSKSAKSVVDILYHNAKARGVEFVLQTAIAEVVEKRDKFVVRDKSYDKLILATGGESAKKISGTDAGYSLAKQFGHSIVDTFPTLVQLITQEADFFQAQGVKCSAKVTAYVNAQERQSATADLLFTKYGLSGNSVLEISRVCSKALLEYGFVEVKVDLFSDFPREKLSAILQTLQKNANEKSTFLILEGILNKKLIPSILKRSGADKELAKDLSKKDLNKLVHTLKNLKFTITDTKGFDFAEVSAGGVDTKEVNPKTFESKCKKNLYLLGELLDIDGDCGGYNLHFAWGGGYLCGKNLE